MAKYDWRKSPKKAEQIKNLVGTRVANKDCPKGERSCLLMSMALLGDGAVNAQLRKGNCHCAVYELSKLTNKPKR